MTRCRRAFWPPPVCHLLQERFASLVVLLYQPQRQYLYCCTIQPAIAAWKRMGLAGTRQIRQNTSAYVSIRQHTCLLGSAWGLRAPDKYVSIRQHTSAYVPAWKRLGLAGTRRSAPRSMRRQGDAVAVRIPSNTACVSIRQHTSAYVSIRRQGDAVAVRIPFNPAATAAAPSA